MACTNDQSEFLRAHDLFESAYGELDENQRAQRLGEAIVILNDLILKDVGNADAYHLLGLCWYELPHISEETSRHAEAAFRAALEIDPGHQYANLYLGHALFDMKRYSEAFERFVRVDAEYFSARKQRWRVIKNDELILCCRLQTDPASVGLNEVSALCEQYESDPEADGIVPREIVLCIDGLINSGRLTRHQALECARIILLMLERTDNLKVRYLEDAVKRLSRINFLQTQR